MDSGQDAVHDCHGMPDNGVSIRLEKNYVRRENFVWCLFIERQATEGDLEENHHLEEVSEMIWTTVVEIGFCPYCGQELAVPSRNKPGDFGRSAHIDCSAWASRWC